jgi:hypothetical protein
MYDISAREVQLAPLPLAAGPRLCMPDPRVHMLGYRYTTATF